MVAGPWLRATDRVPGTYVGRVAGEWRVDEPEERVGRHGQDLAETRQRRSVLEGPFSYHAARKPLLPRLSSPEAGPLPHA